MFRRRKKAAEYEEDYYEDDYYYEDGYYYEDEDGYYYYDDDEDEEVEEEKSTKKSKDTSDSGFVDTVVVKQLDDQREELEQLRKENTNLKNKFATVSALPKHYQQLEADTTALRAELAKAQTESARLAQELAKEAEKVTRAEATVRHYQREINVKQTEIDELTEKVLNTEPTPVEDSGLKSDNQRLTAQVAELTEHLVNQKAEEERLANELVEVKQQLLNVEPDYNKNDIADVMLDAKAKARQIVEQSKYEANRIVKDAELELVEVTRKAEDLYRKVYVTKMDSTNVFEELLSKLSVLSAKEPDRD